MTRTYLVTLSTSVEATSPEEAARRANIEYPDCTVEAVEALDEEEPETDDPKQARADYQRDHARDYRKNER